MKQLGIVTTILALMLLLVSSVYAVAPVISPTVPDQTKDEDAEAWTLDLTDYEPDAEDSGTDLVWSVSGVDTTLFTAEITDVDGDILTFTPVANANGADVITLTLTDSEPDTHTQDITVTLTAVNDAPEVDVSDCTETQGVEDIAYTCEVSATDEEDGDLTTDDLTSSKGTITAGILTWTPTEDDIGSNTVNVIAEDSDGLQGLASFSVFVRPDDVCEDYTSGSDIKIVDWDITEDDEDFYPGDKIEIEVEVENDADDEIEDITVEAILYDTTDGKRLDIIKSEEFDLDEDEDDTVELILEIPEDIDTDNDLIVFVSTYEDGNDNEQCDWEYEDGLDFKRRKHDVNIEKILISPSTVKAGKTVDVKVDVENVGDRDEEDVYVKVKNGELSVDKRSELFDVDSYEKGDDDEYSVTITFTVPEDAEEDNYDLEIQVYDDDNEIYPSGTKFVTLFVEGTGQSSTTTPTPTGSVIISTEGAPEEVEQGISFSIPVKLANTADETKEYTITVSNTGDWAEATSEIEAFLTAEQSSIYYITIMPKADAAGGKHSATINIKEGTALIATKTLSFTIPETTSPITGGTVIDVDDESDGFFQNLFSGTTLWIIGDLVLILVAIFFIKMLFSKRN